MKKFVIIGLLCPIFLFGQENLPNSSKNYDEIIANYKQLTLKQLYDTADIEELEIEREIKENTIHHQRIIIFIILGILFFVIIVLLLLFFQKRKLNKAYKILVDKNVENVELQDNLSEENKNKNRKKVLTDIAQEELLNNILIVMNNPAIICDTDFNVDKLTKLVKSNTLYVSQAINEGLKMNFCSLLNKNRIREAQRLLSENEKTKFTIDFIANKVGFKSSKTFYDAFKENAGVTPGIYLKSIKES